MHTNLQNIFEGPNEDSAEVNRKKCFYLQQWIGLVYLPKQVLFIYSIDDASRIAF